ncbi:DUF2933 domain-containing protein [Aliiroseovarius sp. KMU-50]|uniref:DUF2933 domain-containing protein n=1 Tax=Aliiroseovarius salicola TaxID=3009082 RepID=A0ABT4W5I8_9RHOB|nr:DUF2933 domain-containing protein [Aliiroseovarius sp. KMU-50]MDA5095771.1 DUF2933 domain-containing protein [Aliiroseovarius sp. KMU-50]
MLLPIAVYFLAGGTIGEGGTGLSAFAPLLLCVGAHFLMHRVMGKSCHASKDSSAAEELEPQTRDVTSTVPQVKRG